MNRPVGTRVRENLNKYGPVLNRLGHKHPEFSRTVGLVVIAAQGLTKYHGLFMADQHGQLIHQMRLEDDYSRNVTLIGLDLQQWARNPDLTLRGKNGLDRLYVVLELVLRDALELYVESEKELRRAGSQITMSASDGYGEYERATAALWRFQHTFHMHQIDPNRADRAIVYTRPGHSGLTTDFINNITFPIPDWQKPDEHCIRILTEDEQTQLKNLLTMPKVQKLLPPNLRNPNIIIPPDEDDNSIYREMGPKYEFRGDGILKGPATGPVRHKSKNNVRFGPYVGTPLPSGNVRERVDPVLTPPEPPPTILRPGPRPKIPSPPPPPPRPCSPPSPGSPTPPSASSSTSSSTSSPTLVEHITVGFPDPQENLLGISTVDVKDTETLDTPSSSASSSIPPVDSLSPTQPSSVTEDGHESTTASNSAEDEHDTPPSSPADSIRDEQISLARPEVEVSREVALSIRAYLGRRHDEYSQALEADSTIDLAEDGDEGGSEAEEEDDAVDVPYDDETYAGHHELGRTANHRAARAVRGTALSHWAGVAKAKRAERIEGYTRLRRILKWAEGQGKVPLSPSSIRASTGLRRGIFAPLGLPDLPPPAPATPTPALRRRRAGRDPYRDGTLALLGQLRPRLDVTLPAFLFNEGALRLYAGLVGEQPRPSDLARMDKLLRELEAYTAVCAHRRGLIVGHLRRTRAFPTHVPAQSGDLRAALRGAEEDVLAASRRCFEYVARRSRRVMTYPGGRRRTREFGGEFGARDRERLEYLSGEEDEAGHLRAELAAAEEWHGWCAGVMSRWALGWRPSRVERDMRYVDEETQAELRRYKREINQKRADIGLVPVKRPQDEVYERQREHIRLLDGLWKVVA